MCMIMDTNMWSYFMKKEEDKDMKPIHQWLEKSGKLVYSNHNKFQEELTKKQQKTLRQYLLAGKARHEPKEKVEKAIKEIEKENALKSNDIHILGLAKASKTKVLCTKDKNLHKDFKSIIKGGSIYQDKRHQGLLTSDICP